MSKQKDADLTTTVQVRLYPTPDQSRLLIAHCQEYISTINVLVSALDADMIEENFSTKHFDVPLPSAVKNQALRDARSVFKRSLELGTLPVLKKPICQWNKERGKRDGGEGNRLVRGDSLAVRLDKQASRQRVRRTIVR